MHFHSWCILVFVHACGNNVLMYTVWLLTQSLDRGVRWKVLRNFNIMSQTNAHRWLFFKSILTDDKTLGWNSWQLPVCACVWVTENSWTTHWASNILTTSLKYVTDQVSIWNAQCSLRQFYINFIVKDGISNFSGRIYFTVWNVFWALFHSQMWFSEYKHAETISIYTKYRSSNTGCDRTQSELGKKIRNIMIANILEQSTFFRHQNSHFVWERMTW